MNIHNPFKNTRIEFHILQSFPVTCLNRDDVGAPKTASIGGSTRARVSSQCWKRQVRLEMKKLGVTCGNRTRLVSELVNQACINEGATQEQAEACSRKIARIFIKDNLTNKSKKKAATINKEVSEDSDNESSEMKDNDTLIFLSPKELSILAKAFKNAEFNPEVIITQKDEKKQARELEKLLCSDPNPIDAVDIALFGRMVAKAASMNIEAAASFSHAISTHSVQNEVEFFTALDDLKQEPGAAHMGSLEFNSATYYRYISLDLGQLWQTLMGNQIDESVEAFVKALFIAVPSARQTTQSGASFWDFAKVMIRKGQRLQVPFETSIKAKDGGFLQPSILALENYLEKKEKLSGSLFNKQAEYTLGKEGSEFNIDDLLTSFKEYIHGVTV